MLSDRNHLERMLASVDAAIASAVRYPRYMHFRRADQTEAAVVAATAAELIFISEVAAVAHAKPWAAH